MRRSPQQSRRGQGHKRLQEARVCLRRSLDYDQGNLIARFNLARVERQLGEDEAAVQHFKFIDEFARGASNAFTVSVAAAFAHQQPELRFVARYNRAAALTKLTTWDAHKQAVELLDALASELAEEEPSERPTAEQRRRLSLLVTGTRGATAVFELEHLYRQQSDTPGGVRRLRAPAPAVSLQTLRRRACRSSRKLRHPWFAPSPCAGPLAGDHGCGCALSCRSSASGWVSACATSSRSHSSSHARGG